MSKARSKADETRKQKIQLAVLGALVAVLLAYAFKPFMVGTPIPADAAITTTGPDNTTTPQAEPREQLAIDWPIHSQRNPFYCRALFPPEDVAPIDSTPTADPAPAPRASAVEDAARRLIHLQATLHGTPNRALINGAIYQVGDEVEGFVLERITARKVVVVRNTVRVVIEMPDHENGG
jgi:hypothetical protein